MGGQVDGKRPAQGRHHALRKAADDVEPFGLYVHQPQLSQRKAVQPLQKAVDQLGCVTRPSSYYGYLHFASFLPETVTGNNALN